MAGGELISLGIRKQEEDPSLLSEKAKFSPFSSPSLIIKLNTWGGTHSFIHSFVKSLRSGHHVPGTALGEMPTMMKRPPVSPAFKDLSLEGT